MPLYVGPGESWSACIGAGATAGGLDRGKLLQPFNSGFLHQQ